MKNLSAPLSKVQHSSDKSSEIPKDVMSALHFLQPGNWLPDCLVNFSLSHVTREFSAMCQVIPIDLVHLIKLCHYPDLANLMTDITIGEKPLVLLPLSDSMDTDNLVGDLGKHWSLLVYSTVEKTFFHLDSIHRANSYSAELLAIRLNRE